MDSLSMKSRSEKRSGLTLLELVMVLTILAILAATTIPFVGDTLDQSRNQATVHTLRNVQGLILNRYRVDMAGKLPWTGSGSPNAAQWLIMQGLPGPDPNPSDAHPQPKYLFGAPAPPSGVNVQYDPLIGRGWHGPYLTMSTGTYVPDPARGFLEKYGFDSGDAINPAVLDGWGNPIVIVVPDSSSTAAFLVSAGPDGKLDSYSFDGSTDGLIDVKDLALPLQ